MARTKSENIQSADILQKKKLKADSSEKKDASPKAAKPVKKTIKPIKGLLLPDINSDYLKQIEELKQLNSQLLDDLYRFRDAENTLKFGDYELDIKSDTWKVSQAVNNILGISENDLNSIQSWISIIHPDDRQKIINYFTTLLSGKNNFKAEYRIKSKTGGKIKWILQTGYFDYDTFENPSTMRGIIHDITERKNAEEKVEHLENRLKFAVEENKKDLEELKIAEEQANIKIKEIKKAEAALLASQQRITSLNNEAVLLNKKFLGHIENMPMGYLEINKDHIILNWNPKAEEIFGYKKEEAVGKNVLSLVVPVSARKLVESVAEKLRKGTGGTRSINENITSRGKTIICDWYNTPLYDNEGNISGWASLVNEITEQVRVNKALRENEEKLRLVFNNVPLGIIHFDESGRVLDCNENIVLILGETKDKLLRKNLLELENLEIVDQVKKALEGNSGSYEGKLVSELSRKVISVRIELAPIIREDGKVLGAVGIIEDVSEKKQIERIFFHDVVNTAGNLRGLSTILSENLDNPTKFKFAKLVQQQAEQILGEIKTHRYLLASKSADIKLELKTIKSLEFLNKIVSSFSNSGLPNGIKLKVTSSSKNINFQSDPSILSRVISNMIKNAIEASEQDETITIGCGFEENMVTFWIHNKAYIPDAIKNQLFVRSVSTKGEGRGLGSYSMKILTEQFLKGKIYFTTTPENGTTFVVCYPPEF